MEKEDLSVISEEKFQKYVINRLTPFPLILERAGYHGYSEDGKCFCPFHPNENTPAAKLYVNKGTWTLFCFSEQRTYRPSDVIDRHMIPRMTIPKVFMGIWRQLSDDDKRTLMEDYGKPVSYLPKNWDINKEKLIGFRTGKMNFVQYLLTLKLILRE